MSQAVTSEVSGGCVLPSCGNGTVSVGMTTTGEPGTDAKVSNSGTNKHVILDFEIPRGDEGISAYEVAVKNGYEGTEEEWLASLKGDEGISAYEVAVKDGYVGTEEEWLASLKGDTGERGPAGVESVSASIPSSDTPGTPSVSATLVDGAMSLAFEHLKGETGEKGDKGNQGVGFSSVECPSPVDGTAIITLSNGDTITLDLNHNHPAYPKYQLCTDQAEYDALTTKDSSTLYLIPE